MHELRIYQINEGKMDAWLKLFQSTVVPTHEAEGIKVLAGWRDDEKNQFVWMRDLVSDERVDRLVQKLTADPAMKPAADPDDLGVQVLESRKLVNILAPRF